MKLYQKSKAILYGGMKMAWKLENLRKDPNSKELYADLFISQIKEEPKTACLFTIGDARTVEIILEKYKNTQFVVFDYPALIKFLDFAKPANLFKAIPIKYDWESEKDFLKFVEEEMRKVSIEEVNMSFDLIIANPPYGYKSNVAKDTINAIAKSVSFKQFTCLATQLAFRKTSKYVTPGSLVPIKEQIFEDAAIQGLCLAKIQKEPVQKTKIDILRETFDEKQLQLFDAVTAYNKIHPCVWKGLGTKKPIKENIQYRNRMFAATWWTPNDGVHTGPDSIDQKFNLYNADIDSVGKSILAFLWPTKQERDNFCNWWYSCLKSDIPYSGLTNAFLKVMDVNFGSTGVENFKMFFPNLDWSRPWTDSEILKEIGLPEDFLGKEEC